MVLTADVEQWAKKIEKSVEFATLKYSALYGTFTLEFSTILRIRITSMMDLVRPNCILCCIKKHYGQMPDERQLICYLPHFALFFEITTHCNVYVYWGLQKHHSTSLWLSS